MRRILDRCSYYGWRITVQLIAWAAAPGIWLMSKISVQIIVTLIEMFLVLSFFAIWIIYHPT